MLSESLCLATIDVVKQTGKFIKEEREKFDIAKVEHKGVHNFVTYVDKEAEKMLVSGLANLLPDSAFLAEEGTIETIENANLWIIDPLDGTTNFIHGLSPYAISVALQVNGVTEIGVVYEISLDECFYAIHRKGAYLNGKKIQTSAATSINDSLIATGFPYYNYSRLDGFMKSLSYFMKNSHGIRRLGSAATDLAYVACGRFEAFYEYSLQPWDVAAGALLVTEAGGRVSDFDGGNNYVHGKEIIATNGHIYNDFQKAVTDIFSAS